jgi:phosphate transport system permease protein
MSDIKDKDSTSSSIDNENISINISGLQADANELEEAETLSKEVSEMEKNVDVNQSELSKINSISLKKKFRLSEFLAEKIISTVAFLSIAIILLIFIFVFREALPLFTDTENDIDQQSQIVSEDEKMERYGIGYDEAPSEREESSQSERPEVYGIVVDHGDKEIEARLRGENAEEEEFKLSTFFNIEWQPISDNPRYGLLPLFVGTFKLTIIAILVAAPLGILAALFTSAFAPSWLREIIKPAIELLAGFPSVVIGFFALMVLATTFQDFFGYGSRLNAFVGGVAMSLAAIPIIYTITEDALSSVPSSYREASIALGASPWQTAFFVVLPSATPGIFAAILLGIGRVFGETMIALMATGNASIVSANPFDSVRALSATIVAEMAEVVFGDIHYSVLFFIGSLLFIFTFILNMIAEFYVRGKLVKRFQGKV